MSSDQIEYYFNENWQMISSDSETVVEVNLPYIGIHQSSDVIIFQNLLPLEFAGLAIKFSCENAAVRVLLDEEVLYEQELEGISAQGEYFVNIPNMVYDSDSYGKICIELTVLNSNKETVLKDIIIETRDVILIGLVGSNLANIVCCLLIAIMAMIAFVIALIRRYTGLPGRGELYLGLACLVAGIYCFIGTDTLSIFYNLEEAYAIQEYLVLLLPLLLALYYERSLRSIYPRRFLVLMGLVCVYTVAEILVHLLGLCDLEEMTGVSAAAIGVIGVTAIVSLIQYHRRHRTYQIWISVLAMAALLVSGVTNIVLYLVFHKLYVRTAGQYSITVFSLLMAVQHIFQLAKEHRADVEERAQEAERQNLLLAQAKEDADAARVEALEANEAKGRFLAHMSHEIRTPINAVLGMDEMILRETKEQNIKEYAMDIYQAGQTLLSLINDILDFSKIDSGKMEIVPVEYDISSLIHDLLNMASQRAGEKQIRLEAQVDHKIPSRLYGDDVRIRQVLTNILTNRGKIYARRDGMAAGQ